MRSQHTQGRDRRDAEQRIDHKIEWSVALSADRIGELTDIGGVVEDDQPIRAGTERPLSGTRSPRGREPPTGSRRSSELDRRLADDAASAQNQHLLTGGEPTAP